MKGGLWKLPENAMEDVSKIIEKILAIYLGGPHHFPRWKKRTHSEPVFTICNIVFRSR